MLTIHILWLILFGVLAYEDFKERAISIYNLILWLALSLILLIQKNIHVYTHSLLPLHMEIFLSSIFILIIFAIIKILEKLKKYPVIGEGDMFVIITVIILFGAYGSTKILFFSSVSGIVAYLLKLIKDKELPFVTLIFFGYLINHFVSSLIHH